MDPIVIAEVADRFAQRLQVCLDKAKHARAVSHADPEAAGRVMIGVVEDLGVLASLAKDAGLPVR